MKRVVKRRVKERRSKGVVDVDVDVGVRGG